MPYCPQCGSDKVQNTNPVCPDCGFTMGGPTAGAATTAYATGEGAYPPGGAPGTGQPGSVSPGKTTGSWKKKLGIGLGVVVFIGLLALGAFCFLLGSDSEAVKFAPKDTLAMVYVKPDLLQLYRLLQIRDTYMGDKDFEAIYNEAMDKLEKDKDITYEDDIGSWLGNEAAIIVPNREDNKGPGDPIIAVATDDEEETNKFIAKASGKKYEKNDSYKDVDIYTSSGSSTVYAYLNDFVLVGKRESIELAIATYKGDKGNLGDNDNFKAMLSELPRSRMITGYVDFGDYPQMAMEEIKNEIGQDRTAQELGLDQSIPDLLDSFALGGLQGAAVAVYAESDGIGAQGVWKFDGKELTDEQRKQMEEWGLDMQRYTEHCTEKIMAFGGVNVPGAVMDTGYDIVNKGLDIAEDELNGRSSNLPISLGDVRDYVDASQKAYNNDFTIFLLEDQNGFAGMKEMPVAYVLMRGVESEDDYQEAVKSLKSLAESSGEISVSEDKIADHDANVYKFLGIPSKYDFRVYSALDDDVEIMTTSEDSLEASLSGEADDSRGRLEEALDRLPDRPLVVYYVDAVNTASLTGDLIKKQGSRSYEQYEKYALPCLKPINSFSAGLGDFDPDAGMARATVFIAMNLD